jgi:hypothetical protein
MKSVKHIELGALEDGDSELATIVGRYSRNIWRKRVGSSLQPLDTAD